MNTFNTSGTNARFPPPTFHCTLSKSHCRFQSQAQPRLSLWNSDSATDGGLRLKVRQSRNTDRGPQGRVSDSRVLRWRGQAWAQPPCPLSWLPGSTCSEQPWCCTCWIWLPLSTSRHSRRLRGSVVFIMRRLSWCFKTWRRGRTVSWKSYWLPYSYGLPSGPFALNSKGLHSSPRLCRQFCWGWFMYFSAYSKPI